MTENPLAISHTDHLCQEAVAFIEAHLDLPAELQITETGLLGLETATETQLVELTNGLIYLLHRDALSAEIKLWALGDLVNHGDQKHGDTYTEAIEASGLAYQTVANAASVARKIPYERRQPFPLTFTHHAKVASLSPSEQDWWLTKALAMEWSSRELERMIQADRDRKAGLNPEVEIAKRSLARTAEGLGDLLPEHWASTIERGLLRPLGQRGIQTTTWRLFLLTLRDRINELLKEIT